MVELLLVVEPDPYHLLEELECRPHLVVEVERCRFDLVEHLEMVDLLLDDLLLVLCLLDHREVKHLHLEVATRLLER